MEPASDSPLVESVTPPERVKPQADPPPPSTPEPIRKAPPALRIDTEHIVAGEAVHGIELRNVHVHLVVPAHELSIPEIIDRPVAAIELGEVGSQRRDPFIPPAPGFLVPRHPGEIQDCPKSEDESVQDVQRWLGRVFFEPEVPGEQR